MYVALFLYVMGAVLMYNLMLEEDGPPMPFGINLAIGLFWPLIVPITLIWSFLERKTD